MEIRMIDIILFLFTLALFFAGFWCGAKYGTLTKLGEAIKAKFS
jgi:hypothetical protein